jgi:succinate dehydrogenase flavin-adding protein (antitoxin of CptAB toxin-antitoxin module)
LSHNEQEVFAELLNCPDQLLFEYLMGGIQPIDKDVAHVVEQIRHPTQV